MIRSHTVHCISSEQALMKYFTPSTIAVGDALSVHFQLSFISHAVLDLLHCCTWHTRAERANATGRKEGRAEHRVSHEIELAFQLENFMTPVYFSLSLSFSFSFSSCLHSRRSQFHPVTCWLPVLSRRITRRSFITPVGRLGYNRIPPPPSLSLSPTFTFYPSFSLYLFLILIQSR